ncbi:hypothetical protein BC826DRAFT_592322 [Russula brevipes]|nr:hypothetical protein BC826DRAFT_592322 [Russula brevipes]
MSLLLHTEFLRSILPLVGMMTMTTTSSPAFPGHGTRPDEKVTSGPAELVQFRFSLMHHASWAMCERVPWRGLVSCLCCGYMPNLDMNHRVLTTLQYLTKRLYIP